MINDILMTSVQNLRGTDSNSLLRLYDQANEALHKLQSHQERARAEKALQRVARELNKRGVSFSAALT